MSITHLAAAVAITTALVCDIRSLSPLSPLTTACDVLPEQVRRVASQSRARIGVDWHLPLPRLRPTITAS